MTLEGSELEETDISVSTNDTAFSSIKTENSSSVLIKRTLTARFDDRQDHIGKAWDSVNTKRPRFGSLEPFDLPH